MTTESRTYSLSGHDAKYSVKEDGKVTVNVLSASPLKFRAVYFGAAILKFRWVSTGKSTDWQFQPTLMDPKPAQFITSAAQDGKGEIVSVEFGEPVFPAAGFVKSNVTGAIMAPGVHFDIPHAYDLWIFLLRSPWFPLKLDLEKTSLSVTHGSALGRTSVYGQADQEGTPSLKTELSLAGEGFSRLWLSLKRTLPEFSIDETIGEITTRMEQFTWKPTLRSFDVLLVVPSNVSLMSFLSFLRSLGVDAKVSSFSLSLRFLPNDFILCDGPALNYTLSLVGDKHLMGHERDEIKMSLSA